MSAVECSECPLVIDRPKLEGYWGIVRCVAGLYGRVCSLGLNLDPQSAKAVFAREQRVRSDWGQKE